jgi:integrase
MGSTNFVLKEPKADKQTIIYLVYHFDSTKLKFSTGEKIHPKKWSFDKQAAKTSHEGHADLNNYLQQIASSAQNAYTNIRASKDIPTPDKIREALDQEFKKGKGQKPKGFFEVFNEFVEAQKAIRRDRTIQKYKSLETHLRNFERKRKQKITFEGIDHAFFDSLRAYFINDLEFFNNTLDKYVKTFKTFMNWATKTGYNQKQDYSEFKTTRAEKEVIYLTEDELYNKLYSIDLSSKKRLEKVRDLFYFACHTGLRYSDISQLSPDHIEGGSIVINTIKTDDRLTIPILPQAREILEKYDYRLPAISNQKVNDYLKETARRAGIDETVILTRYRGGQRVEEKEPKHKMLSFHGSRRTFITLSLKKGLRIETVMAITGIKDYKTLKKYIKITEGMKAEELNQAWGNGSPLRVAQ